MAADENIKAFEETSKVLFPELEPEFVKIYEKLILHLDDDNEELRRLISGNTLTSCCKKNY